MIGPDRHLALATWLEDKECRGDVKVPMPIWECLERRSFRLYHVQSTQAESILLMYSTIRHHSNHKMLIQAGSLVSLCISLVIPSPPHTYVNINIVKNPIGYVSPSFTNFKSHITCIEIQK